MDKRKGDKGNRKNGISRRYFLGTSAATGAALLTGRWGSLLAKNGRGNGNFDFVEASINQLQDAMAAGQISSRELVMDYINRIQSLNPLLHAVIETNPNAISIAVSLDNERRAGHVRGPLHGIPILVKDN